MLSLLWATLVATCGSRHASPPRSSCTDLKIEDGEATGSSATTRQCSRVQSSSVARGRHWVSCTSAGSRGATNMAYGRGVGPRGGFGSDNGFMVKQPIDRAQQSQAYRGR